MINALLQMMKRIMIWSLVFCSCGCKSKPVDKIAPAGNFLRAEAITQKIDSSKINLQTQMPSVRVFKNKQLLKGRYSLKGTITVFSQNEIRIDSGNQVFTIHTQWPKDMQMRARKQTKGLMIWQYDENPGGSNSFFQLSADEKLLAGYVWQSSTSPINFGGPAGLILEQVPPPELPKKPGTVPVTVQIASDEGEHKNYSRYRNYL